MTGLVRFHEMQRNTLQELPKKLQYVIFDIVPNVQ